MLVISRQSARITTLLTVFLLSACASTQDKQPQQAPLSFDMVIYNKARSAFEAGNYKVAASLFDPLAENGNADAQYSLGYLYYHGKGVTRNLKQATHWFTLSAQQGNQKAAAALKTIEAMLASNGQTGVTNNDTLQLETEPDSGPAQEGIVDLRQRLQQRANTREALPRSAVPQQPTDVQPTTITPSSDNTVRTTPPVIKKPAVENAQSTPIARSAIEMQHRKWILQQPSGHFTIQLASSTRKRFVMEYIRKVALDGVYFFSENDTSRYYVIHGSFSTYSKAKRKLKLLHQRGYKDAWIKDIKGIKKRLTRQ